MRTVIKTCISLMVTGLFFLSAYAVAAQGNPKVKDKKMYAAVKACQTECKNARKKTSGEVYEDCMSKCWNDNQKDQMIPPVKK